MNNITTTGLKTLVRQDLRMRGLTWDRKAPVATANRKAQERLSRRIRQFDGLPPVKQAASTKPGSMKP